MVANLDAPYTFADVTPLQPHTVYDPSFLLPCLLHSLTSARISPRKLVSSGGLGVLMCATTSFRAGEEMVVGCVGVDATFQDSAVCCPQECEK